MNKQKGFLSTFGIIIIVGITIVLSGVLYFWVTNTMQEPGLSKEPLPTVISEEKEEPVEEKEEAKETIELLQETTSPAQQTLLYPGASLYKLTPEQEKFMEGAEFPKTTQIKYYTTDDSSGQVFGWYEIEFKKEGWSLAVEDINLWRKGDEVFMVQAVSPEDLEEWGIDRTLIVHMKDSYINWEDYLLKEEDVVGDSLKNVFESWMKAIFTEDWVAFHLYTVDDDGEPFSEECMSRAKKVFEGFPGLDYSLEINPEINTTCVKYLGEPIECVKIDYEITVAGSTSKDEKQIMLKIQNDWKVQLLCEDLPKEIVETLSIAKIKLDEIQKTAN